MEEKVNRIMEKRVAENESGNMPYRDYAYRQVYARLKCDMKSFPEYAAGLIRERAEKRGIYSFIIDRTVVLNYMRETDMEGSCVLEHLNDCIMYGLLYKCYYSCGSDGTLMLSTMCSPFDNEGTTMALEHDMTCMLGMKGGAA